MLSGNWIHFGGGCCTRVTLFDYAHDMLTIIIIANIDTLRKFTYFFLFMAVIGQWGLQRSILKFTFFHLKCFASFVFEISLDLISEVASLL